MNKINYFRFTVFAMTAMTACGGSDATPENIQKPAFPTPGETAKPGEGDFPDTNPIPPPVCPSDPVPDPSCPSFPEAIVSRCYSGGPCQFTGCSPGFLDCDRRIQNGCETDIASDPDNCGECFIHCPSGAVCLAGRCAPEVR